MKGIETGLNGRVAVSAVDCPDTGAHPYSSAVTVPAVVRNLHATPKVMNEGYYSVVAARRRRERHVYPQLARALVFWCGRQFERCYEPHEWQICHIPQAKLIPLGELPNRINELDSADEIIAHCKSGARSAKAVEFLKQSGFKRSAT